MVLALACWSSCSGCLASDEPTFGEPGKTPPFLLAQFAVPAVTQVLNWTGTPQDLTVRVRSEDNNDGLVAKLVLNYAPGGSKLEQDLANATGEFEPGHMADDNRLLKLTITSIPDGWTGCQTVSMVVTHRSNVTLQDGVTFIDKKNDIGVLTWWLNVPGGKPPSLDDCSTSETSSP